MGDSTTHALSKLYGVNRWSDGYFSIAPSGDVLVHTHQHQSRLTDLVEQAKTNGLGLPLLIRFTDIIQDRIQQLTQAFNQAKSQHDYQGNYTAAFPIKVNQQRQVVESVLDCDIGHVGLEAGSKAELLAVIALSPKHDSVIVCNGYKDKEYVQLALMGQQLGHRVYLIIEKLSELDLVLAQAKYLGVEPKLGIRTRLASIGKGKWQNTGGEKAKFGLSSSQVMDAIRILDAHNALDWLQVLHFHMGSQIANIRDIQQGLQEGAQYFAQLHQLGVNIHTIDVGGGLGVDYAGLQSRHDCSINYSMAVYADRIVSEFSAICDKYGLPHPNIITESGRSTVAHHAVLVTNIIDQEHPPTVQDRTFSQDSHDILQHLNQLYDNLDSENVQESLHDADHWLQETHILFNHGQLTLATRADIEASYVSILRKADTCLDQDLRIHRELKDKIRNKLAIKLFCNFSVFQSIPDVWAIQQIFPIMPLSQLNKPLSEHAVIQDLTCDSDGRIDEYVAKQSIETTLALPAFDPKDPYHLGIFLVGAYQETLGDIHNLFGDTNTVSFCWSNEAQRFVISEQSQGENIEMMLRTVQYDCDLLVENYAKKLEETDYSYEEQKAFLIKFKSCLLSYTYLD